MVSPNQYSSEEESSDGEVKISDDDDLQSLDNYPLEPTPSNQIASTSKIPADEDIEHLELDANRYSSPKPVPERVAESSAAEASATEKTATSIDKRVEKEKPGKEGKSKKESKTKKEPKPKKPTNGPKVNATTKLLPLRPNKGKKRGDYDGEEEGDFNMYSIWPLRKPSNEYVDLGPKPPYSFPTLIGQAMHYNSDKKLTSAAISEWIMNVYPWFADNRETVNWHVCCPSRLAEAMF